MFTKLRVPALAAACAALLLAACGEQKTLPTSFDPTETQADVDAFEVAFEAPATASFAGLGYAMDNALLFAGGVTLRLPTAMLREGPERPLTRERERIAAVLFNAEEPAALPITARGKTFVWDPELDIYVESARVGAPASGVRFILYAMDPVDEGLPALPLVELGYVDLIQTSAGNTTSASVEVVGPGGTTLMQYTATVGGTDQAPAFSLTGFAGISINRVNFELNFGYNLVNQSIVSTWRTELPARGLSSRVQLTFNNTSFTIGAVIQRGLRKIEMLGTLSFDNGGTVTVRVGNRLFATMTFPADPLLPPTITNAQGQPLTAEQEETLERIFDWFSGAFDAPGALLDPIYVLLGFDEPA
jgi:hypothetical protein